MQKAGGIIALIAGIFGVIAAIVTLSIGGIGSAFEAEDAGTVVGLGWGGLGFSFATIVLGAVALGSRSRLPGLLLIFSALAGVVLGGTLVAVFMVLALIGGILAMVGTKPVRKMDDASYESVGMADVDQVIARHLAKAAQQPDRASDARQPTASGFGRRNA